MALTLLPPDDYRMLHELCAPLSIHLAVTAILADETPARIYIDDVHAPMMAIILPWDGHRVFLAGASSDEETIQGIREILLSFFSPSRDDTSFHEFLLYYASSSWESSIALLCQGMEASMLRRCYYLISQAPAYGQEPLPADWRLRQVDATLLGEQHLHNLPELIAEIYSESPSREDFLARKFGYCLQEHDTLLGWCLSEYNHADRCEVGIGTMPPYRRRGGAFLLASALIAHARAQGITHIGWHCWAHNRASSALALKLGGQLVAEYPVQVCRLKS